MTTQQQAQDLIGATAYDQAGQKVGNVSEIYYDRSTGEPEWLTVKTGLFGMKENFVPLALARPRGQGEVEFAAGKDVITGAPKIDPDGRLTARGGAAVRALWPVLWRAGQRPALRRAGRSRRAGGRRADGRAGR
jgi:PRC-barrel domain protein